MLDVLFYSTHVLHALRHDLVYLAQASRSLLQHRARILHVMINDLLTFSKLSSSY
jgi:hypothetical protein